MTRNDKNRGLMIGAALLVSLAAGAAQAAPVSQYDPDRWQPHRSLEAKAPILAATGQAGSVAIVDPDRPVRSAHLPVDRVATDAFASGERMDADRPARVFRHR
ncbi:MAG: hypothetical protein HXY25_12755 [Alphaproteobacteria bacterium]|nr:hypothetical protein [Alphaproteobacteria bacterium]